MNREYRFLSCLSPVETDTERRDPNSVIACACSWQNDTLAMKRNSPLPGGDCPLVRSAPKLCVTGPQGGVTPSIGDIESTVSALAGSDTRVHVLIRPRPGDFVYSALEKQVSHALFDRGLGIVLPPAPRVMAAIGH